MSISRVFVGRLAGKGVFDPLGDKIGKVRDLIVVERAKQAPRVTGMIVEIPGRKRVFTPIGRITSITGAQVLSTGLINVRRYQQHGSETRVLAQLIGREVSLSSSPQSAHVKRGTKTMKAYIEDAAITKTRSGEWIVSEVFVRLPKTGTFSRGETRLVPWSELNPSHETQQAASTERLIQQLIDLKPADLAESLLELPDARRAEVIAELSDELIADALEEMSEADQLKVLAPLDTDRAADVIDEMEPDDAADLIAALPEGEGEELLKLMEPEEAEDIRRLLEYEHDTAGGLMNPTPIILSGESSIAEALAMIRRAEIPPAMAAAVYVTLPPYETPTGEFQGVAHFQQMLRVPPHERLSAVIDEEIDVVHVNDSAAEVARRLASYDLVAVPVVDHQRNLLGVVTIDDVLDHLLPEDWRHADDHSSRGGDIL